MGEKTERNTTNEQQLRLALLHNNNYITHQGSKYLRQFCSSELSPQSSSPSHRQFSGIHVRFAQTNWSSPQRNAEIKG